MKSILVKYNFIFVILTILGLSSCQKENSLTPFSSETESDNPERRSHSSYSYSNQYPSTTPCGNTTTIDLMAGQHTDIGSIEIFNDQDSLYIVYLTNSGWTLKLTHLTVGQWSEIPVNGSGNPKIGHFPYSEIHSPSTDTAVYSISFNDLNWGENDCLYVAAHAEAVMLNANGHQIRAETAWGDGTRFVNRGSWAMYTEYCKQDCSREAFANGFAKE